MINRAVSSTGHSRVRLGGELVGFASFQNCRLHMLTIDSGPTQQYSRGTIEVFARRPMPNQLSEP